jgi:hypothetical protein
MFVVPTSFIDQAESCICIKVMMNFSSEHGQHAVVVVSSASHNVLILKTSRCTYNVYYIMFTQCVYLVRAHA